MRILIIEVKAQLKLFLRLFKYLVMMTCGRLEAGVYLHAFVTTEVGESKSLASLPGSFTLGGITPSKYGIGDRKVAK